VLAIALVACHAAHWLLRAGTTGGTEPDERTARGVAQLEIRVARPSYVLLLVTGVILLVDGDWSLGQAWVIGSLALFAVLGAVSLGPRKARLAAVGAIVVIAYLMVTKPT
jgi:uncharacterized membrane protein